MRELCFGGSFNPIHNGHLACARQAAEALGFQRVRLIPAGHPPHKPDPAEIADPEHRLQMCQLAASLQRDLFDVDALEIHRPLPSYTIDTVRQLRQMRTEKTVNWLIGADMLLYLPNWRDPEALLQEVNFVILQRPGFEIDWDALPAMYQPLRQNVVTAPLLEISSTDIRQRIAAGKSIQYLVPPAVADYIAEKELYRPRV